MISQDKKLQEKLFTAKTIVPFYETLAFASVIIGVGQVIHHINAPSAVIRKTLNKFEHIFPV